MIYALVKDGNIIEGPRSLPENWENVSRLDTLPQEMLFELGWYPVRTDDVPKYDGSKQYLVTRYVVEQDHVQETFDIVDFTSAEIEQAIELAWMQLRKERDQFLADSDWTELPSVRAIRSPEWAAEWDTYRQSLRDMTNNISIDRVVWPRKPGLK